MPHQPGGELGDMSVEPLSRQQTRRRASRDTQYTRISLKIFQTFVKYIERESLSKCSNLFRGSGGIGFNLFSISPKKAKG